MTDRDAVLETPDVSVDFSSSHFDDLGDPKRAISPRTPSLSRNHVVLSFSTTFENWVLHAYGLLAIIVNPHPCLTGPLLWV